MDTNPKPATHDEVAKRVDELIDALTFEEQIGMLSGDDPVMAGSIEMVRRYNARPIVAGAVPRLGIEGVRFSDGPRGVVMYSSTAFPSSMARGATFDPSLEERIGDVIGVETRAQGANLFAGVCVNLLRHPAWGRAQETYGEDSYLLGEMGAALTRGVQRHVMACVKHFAVNSMENSRFWVDVRIDERDLRDIYLPHFRRIVDEGVASVMSAYNRLNGEFCGHNRTLLTDILKREWGFEGFVMSDFAFGVRGPSALNAGLDLEMPFDGWFRLLPSLVRRGRVDAASVGDAARRLLSMQVRFADRGEPDRYEPEVVACVDHRALAREAAARSLVLLRNEPVERPGGSSALPLPFDVDRVRSVAVIGGLAAMANLGDKGSSAVRPPEVITVLAGVEALASEHGIDVRFDDGSDPDRAASVAANCDAVITVVGATWRDEGEWVLLYGGDRSSLALSDSHVELVRAVGRRCAGQVVVLMGGSVVLTDGLDDVAPAQVMAWYPGMEGGRAIAEMLFGLTEPEGRLPLTWPRATTRLPPFRRFARRVRYGPLHGYRLMEATRQQPAHWFGHGLSYTTFEWSEPIVRSAEPSPDVVVAGTSVATVEVRVRNTGERTGTEVVQVYVREVLGTHPDALLSLRGFAVQRAIEVGEERVVVVDVAVTDEAEIFVGPSADRSRLVAARWA